MSSTTTIRDQLALMFRFLPQFRGKSHLGAAIGRRLTNVNDDQSSIVTVKMKDGSIMRLDVRSRTEIWAYWTGRYDNDIISKLATCLEKESVVFDVGANVGFYSIALAKRLQPLGGSLYAFEPVSSNFSRIVESTKLNGLEQVIQSFNLALGDEEGSIEMYMEDTNQATSGNAILRKGKTADEGRHNVTARITKLDTIAEEKNIKACHLIKIDVEGAEVMFLRGGINFISEHRPIIYGEFNSYWIKQFGHSFTDVVDLMKPLDYRFFKQENKGQFVEVLNPEEGIQDMILAPRETSDSTLKKLGVSLP